MQIFYQEVQPKLEFGPDLMIFTVIPLELEIDKV
jgi:hypothetical protein